MSPTSKGRRAAGKAASAKRSSAKSTAAKRSSTKTSTARGSSQKQAAGSSRDGVERSMPKTTRPEASERRAAETVVTTERKLRRRLDAHPDRIDIRDWFYQPSLSPLPDQLINIEDVPDILDQGQEGACTGYALAAVVNFLLRRRGILERRVSPRMLYEMARRYDEWPRENYSGSSARGAMKGWVAHGVCEYERWPPQHHGARHLTVEIGREAQRTPGGAFFRLQHRQIRDMHAALNEVGIIFCTIMVHDGWQDPGTGPKAERRRVAYASKVGSIEQIDLPVIVREGRADSGHAVAIVGYTDEGFIVQNSWGPEWGAGGFALLPYEDYMLHATDCWVAQLGVPVKLDLWSNLSLEVEDISAGLQRATPAIPLSEIRPYAIDVGNNGELSSSGRYWTTEDDISRLFTETIPEASKGWKKKRVVLYLHGGLNDEAAVARRIVAFRDVLLRNEIYPVHIMWESGVKESLTGLISDLFTDSDERSGSAISGWLKKVREGALEVRDRTFELTAAAPGGALWREMKENARLSSQHARGLGGMQLLIKHARAALDALPPARRDAWELHVVGHSAGAIYAAHAIPHLAQLGVNFKSLHLMAPAISVADFRREMLPFIKKRKCPHPSLYILSDVGERDDTVGPYGKSLLFLVSNAFEEERGTPLLGMERFVSRRGETGGNYIGEGDEDIIELFEREVDGLPSLVVAGAGAGAKSTSRSDSHGGFDNDEWTLNSILRRVLGDDKPQREFSMRDLQY
ncbi:MAG TPA: C1 family peptidase [Pyrinomonadaceae bacterium]|nr:C1 family peptidase [Pyrinomonadaceae bacterium]